MIHELRNAGGDTAHIEVKSALRGFPDSVMETLSAFANTPEGGEIIFGLDESEGFTATGVYDPQLCQQAVVNMARHGLLPAMAITTEIATLDGTTVVIAHVPEADRTLKPVKVRKSGLAYLRQYDGDYAISELEEQAFIADRGQPTFDEVPVERASITDLDATAVQKYLAERRLVSPTLAAMTDDDVLLRTGVIVEGHPTVSGLLSLGIYPQQFFANLGIQASLLPAGGSRPETRAFDSASITGSIPTMLEEAVSWVYRTAGRSIVGNARTGAVTNKLAYPLIAVRELVANALIHRDLGPHALNQPITLQIQGNRLLISNPGGLFGLRLDSLGHTPSHLRNGRLAEMCQYVTTRGRERVVERLGTGIPAVRESLKEAGMNPPLFIDQGVRFVAIMLAEPAGTARPSTSSAIVQSTLASRGPLTTRQLCTLTGLTARQTTHALRQLVSMGQVTASPIDGRSNLYTLT